METKKNGLLNSPEIYIGVFLTVAYAYFALIQGYWRHDSWIYTKSQLHDALDGGRLLEPILHKVFHGISPKITILGALISIFIYLNKELRRIIPRRQNIEAKTIYSIISLSVFSSGFASQLHWPTHTMVATIPLWLSLVLISRKGLKIRILRCLIISMGSLMILSSLICFAPLALIPSDESSNRKESPTNVENTRANLRSIYSMIVGWPVILAISFALTYFSRTFYTTFILKDDGSLLTSRLDKVIAFPDMHTLNELFNSSGLFALRQWGEASVPLGASLLAVCVCIILSMKNRQVLDQLLLSNLGSALIILGCTFFILVLPVWTSVLSGTLWQRVVLSWAAIPPLISILALKSCPMLLRRATIIISLFASIQSALIGLTNFSLSAYVTRNTLSTIQNQINSKNDGQTLYILRIRNSSNLTPHYIWGGWPPFASNKPSNPRLYRVFDEMRINNYIIINNKIRAFSSHGVIRIGSMIKNKNDFDSGSLLQAFNEHSKLNLKRAFILWL